MCLSEETSCRTDSRMVKQTCEVLCGWNYVIILPIVGLLLKCYCHKSLLCFFSKKERKTPKRYCKIQKNLKKFTGQTCKSLQFHVFHCVSMCMCVYSGVTSGNILSLKNICFLINELISNIMMFWLTLRCRHAILSVHWKWCSWLSNLPLSCTFCQFYSKHARATVARLVTDRCIHWHSGCETILMPLKYNAWLFCHL